MIQSADLPLREYSAMSEQEIAGSDTSRWIAVLPLGATEQHGPHLPLETDTLIAEAVVDRIKAELKDEAPVTFLPAETIGYSPEHLDYPGTRSLKFNEAIRRWVGIGEKLSALGIKKMVLLNAHGGNSPLMTVVATELRVHHSMLVVATSWTRFGVPEGIIKPEEKAIDIHGGLIETSVMLAAHPNNVNMEKASNFGSAQSELIKQYKHLRAYGPHAFGWKIQDLNADGVCGNAAAATPEIGNKLLDHAAKGFVELLEDIDRHPGFSRT